MNFETTLGKKTMIASAALVLGFGASSGMAADTESIQVQFANSCAVDVKEEINHAVTLLHSFEYVQTIRIFNEISEQDPGCAMAHWGAAMSIWHPLWGPPGEADLEAGARHLAATEGLQKTAREVAYIDALKVFFSSTDMSTHAVRARAYGEKMADVYASNLDDPEATVFYALALLAGADPRDKSYARQYKSAALLNWVQSSQPTHPGVLHYLIHSYDYPGLAHLALNSAKIYADAAPDSAHAQHMPSHIFTRLGLWDRSLSSNHDSTRSAAEFTVHAGLPGHYDEGLHSIDYLMYAMMQTARDEEAQELLLTLAQITKTDTENFKVAYAYAASPARYVLERRAWEEAATLDLIRKNFAWDDFGWAMSIHYFARGLGAARMGDLHQAREELQIVRTLQNELSPNALPYWREEMQVQTDSLRSWIMYAEGDVESALALAAAAAVREDAVDKHPVTPGEVLPARELYADMLYEAERHGEALAQYQEVLRNSPNRLNALIGAAHAASKSGDATLASGYRETIKKQTGARYRSRENLVGLMSP
jgi:tetratricopeptide (TPR) repeat protein